VQGNLLLLKKVLDTWIELDNQQEIKRILARLDLENKQLAQLARKYAVVERK
jgi:hypothetical protein